MEKVWSEFLEKIQNFLKPPKKNSLILLLLTGILLLVIVWPASDREEKSTESLSGNESTDPGTETDFLDDEDYKKDMEKRLSEALGRMEGVGQAEVVITWKSTGQRVIEKDQSSDSQVSSEADGGGGTREIQERSYDKSSVYTQQSDGSQTPYVSKELTPDAEGVLVIADGGDNPVVVQNITEAVQALFGLEAHKIKIMKRADT